MINNYITNLNIIIVIGRISIDIIINADITGNIGYIRI